MFIKRQLFFLDIYVCHEDRKQTALMYESVNYRNFMEISKFFLQK